MDIHVPESHGPLLVSQGLIHPRPLMLMAPQLPSSFALETLTGMSPLQLRMQRFLAPLVPL